MPPCHLSSLCRRMMCVRASACVCWCVWVGELGCMCMRGVHLPLLQTRTTPSCAAEPMKEPSEENRARTTGALWPEKISCCTTRNGSSASASCISSAPVAPIAPPPDVPLPLPDCAAVVFVLGPRRTLELTAEAGGLMRPLLARPYAGSHALVDEAAVRPLLAPPPTS